MIPKMFRRFEGLWERLYDFAWIRFGQLTVLFLELDGVMGRKFGLGL